MKKKEICKHNSLDATVTINVCLTRENGELELTEDDLNVSEIKRINCSECGHDITSKEMKDKVIALLDGSCKNISGC